MRIVQLVFIQIAVLIALLLPSAPVTAQIQRQSYQLGATEVGSPLLSNGVSHIVPSNDTLWIGTSKGLSRTTNAGGDWTNFKGIPEFPNDVIYALAVRHSVIWTSLAYEQETAVGKVTTGNGLTYSSDGGRTWNHIDQPMDARGDSLILYGKDTVKILPVVVPEQNVSYDVSVSSRSVWIASWAGSVRKSTNNGQTWQRILLPPDYRNSIAPGDTLIYTFDPRKYLNLLGFSVLAVDDSTIWAGTAGGVNKSTDGGVTWKKFNHLNQVPGILGNWVIAIDEQRLKGRSRIWTVNWKTDDPTEQYGVSYTDDGGLTWVNLLEGIKAYSFAFKDSIIYVGTEEGVFRSDNDGKQWSAFSTFVDSRTWQRVTSPQVYAIGVQADTIWLGTGDGLVKTLDNATHPFGESWQLFRAAQPVESKSSTYAYPNPFSPNAEIARFHYSTGGKDAKVTIQVFDFGMNVVRTVIQNAQRNGTREQDEIWDGRDDNRNQVANGVYFYRIRIDDDSPVWGKVMVLQ